MTHLSLLHPLFVSLLSVSYFFVSNLTVEEAAILKQKGKEVVSTAIEREVMPRLSSYVEENRGALPSSVEIEVPFITSYSR